MKRDEWIRPWEFWLLVKPVKTQSNIVATSYFNLATKLNYFKKLQQVYGIQSWCAGLQWCQEWPRWSHVGAHGSRAGLLGLHGTGRARACCGWRRWLWAPFSWWLNSPTGLFSPCTSLARHAHTRAVALAPLRTDALTASVQSEHRKTIAKISWFILLRAAVEVPLRLSLVTPARISDLIAKQISVESQK